MAILQEDDLKTYVREFPEELGLTSKELIDNYEAGVISQERVIENIKRSVETAMKTVAESLGLSLEDLE